MPLAAALPDLVCNSDVLFQKKGNAIGVLPRQSLERVGCVRLVELFRRDSSQAFMAGFGRSKILRCVQYDSRPTAFPQ